MKGMGHVLQTICNSQCTASRWFSYVSMLWLEIYRRVSGTEMPNHRQIDRSGSFAA